MIGHRQRYIDNDVFASFAKNYKLKQHDSDKIYWDDFSALGFDDDEIEYYSPVGIKMNNVMNNVSTIPYDNPSTSDKRSLVENNRILEEYHIPKNELNLVYITDMSIIDSDIVQTYFPMLTVFEIETRDDFVKKTEQIRDSLYNKVDDNFANKFHNIRTLYEYSEKIDTKNISVQSINILRRGINTDIKLPIGKIFKTFQTSRFRYLNSIRV